MNHRLVLGGDRERTRVMAGRRIPWHKDIHPYGLIRIGRDIKWGAHKPNMADRFGVASTGKRDQCIRVPAGAFLRFRARLSHLNVMLTVKGEPISGYHL